MKIGLRQLESMVAEAVKRTVAEAKAKGRKPKEIPMRSPESVKAQKDNRTKGLPGYTDAPAADEYSQPLGDDNLYRRQGQSNMGGWTAEAVLRKMREAQLRRVIRGMVERKVKARRG